MSPVLSGRPDRILAEAVAGLLPDGLVAVPVRPGDVESVTELMRAAELAACGSSTTNLAEVRNDLAGADCGWQRGAAMVRRDDGHADGGSLLGALVIFDLLADGGWLDVDPYVLPDDGQAVALAGALVEAGLAEGRARWAWLREGPASSGYAGSPEGSESPTPADPLAKGGCYAADAITRTAFEANGFAEVRRFWRMQIDHPVDRGDSPGGAAGSPPAPLADGYRIRPFRADDPAEWQAMFEVGQRSFADHFDFTPSRYDTWRAHVTGTTDDVTQWLVVERDEQMVAFIRGSDRYASEGAGYVPTLGVLREHRGRGLARALLAARFADDARRGRGTTLLHVDSESPTGATRLYESVGMRVQEEIVAFHRPLLD